MTEIRIPKPGDAVEEGTLAEWRVADGSAVTTGQVIYQLETDKVQIEVEAPCDGVLKILEKEGEVYSVGTLVATIE